MTRDDVLRVVCACVVLTIAGVPSAVAQAAAPSVQWRATAAPDPTDARGHRATLELLGVVPEGWHVYALNQVPGGPTPLQVTLQDRVAVRVTGGGFGTAPEKRHDPSFDLDTEFYTHSFTLHFPLESQRSITDSPSLPVSVRFQLCSERECQPPKTIHLIASIEVPAT
jgi:hypothetical protein